MLSSNVEDGCRLTIDGETAALVGQRSMGQRWSRCEGLKRMGKMRLWFLNFDSCFFNTFRQDYMPLSHRSSPMLQENYDLFEAPKVKYPM